MLTIGKRIRIKDQRIEIRAARYDAILCFYVLGWIAITFQGTNLFLQFGPLIDHDMAITLAFWFNWLILTGIGAVYIFWRP